MPVADQTRVLKRVTEILNLCDAGAYSSTLSTRNKTRNAAAIADFVTEAGFKLLQMLAETPSEYRHNYVSEITPTYQQLLPDHQGQPLYVDIESYPGAGFEPGEQKDYQRIVSYRDNPGKVYDTKDHNVSGSAIGGFYDVWEQRFYFTGNSAKVGLAIVTRADVATKVPEIMENTWIRLAIGEAAKVGTGQYEMGVVSLYGQKGEADMQEFKTGKRSFAEVSEPQPTNEVHIQ
jgi:hypothetical protein